MRSRLIILGVMILAAGLSRNVQSANRHVTCSATTQEGEDSQSIDSATIQQLFLSASSFHSDSCEAKTYGLAGYKRIAAMGTSQANSCGLVSAGTWINVVENLRFHAGSQPAGAIVKLTCRVDIEGLVTAGGSCSDNPNLYYANANFLVAGYDIYLAIAAADDSSGPDIPLKSGSYFFEIEWENDIELPLAMGMKALGQNYAGKNCSASSTAGLNSMTWRGVESVTDAKGNAITDYTFTDEFGRDWSTPKIDADITEDDAVDVDDLLAVINAWGECQANEPCNADIVNTGYVDIDDLLLVINSWT